MAIDSKEAIEELRSKLEILKSMFSILKLRNEQLLQEKENLEQIIERQQNSIAELEAQVKTLQLAKAISGSTSENGDNSARKYIEGIVREIDSCIALLNK